MLRRLRLFGSIAGEIMTCTIGGSSFCATRFSVTVNRWYDERSPPTMPCPSCHTISADGRAGSTSGRRVDPIIGSRAIVDFAGDRLLLGERALGHAGLRVGVGIIARDVAARAERFAIHVELIRMGHARAHLDEPVCHIRARHFGERDRRAARRWRRRERRRLRRRTGNPVPRPTRRPAPSGSATASPAGLSPPANWCARHRSVPRVGASVRTTSRRTQ